MICPECGAALNLLAGADGYAAERVIDGRRVVERRRLANVYACPACDFAQVGAGNGPAGDTWAAWCRALERSGVARSVAALSAAEDLAFYARRHGRARSARELGARP